MKANSKFIIVKRFGLLVLLGISSLTINGQQIVNYLEASRYVNSLCFFNNRIYYSGAVNTYSTDSSGLIEDCFHDVAGDFIEVDFEGKFWIGRKSGGLYYIKDSRVFRYASNFVNFIKKDGNNNVWIGMRSVLIRISKNGIDTISNSEYSQIDFSRTDKNVWLVNYFNGISKYDGKTLTTYDYSNLKFSDLAIDNNNNIWLLSSPYGTFYKYSISNSIWTQYTDSRGKNPKFQQILFGLDNKLYGLSTHYNDVDSILVLQNDLWTKIGLPKLSQSSYNSIIKHLMLSEKGNICLPLNSTDYLYSGYCELINGNWQHKPLRVNNYPTNTEALCVDSFKHIWYGSLGRIGFIEGGKFYNIETSLSWYYDVALDQNGKIWFGGSGNKFGYWDFNTGKVDLSNIFTSNVTVYSILCDKNNKIWAGTNNGVYTNKDGSWKHMTRANNLQSDTITAIACDSLNRIYFGCEGKGISILDNQTWKYVTKSEGLQTTSITDMIFDKKGVLHVLGMNSFSYYKNGNWKNYNGGGYDLYVDSKNQVLCSHSNGLTSFVDGTFKSVYSGTNIRTSVEDSHNNIWMGGCLNNFIKLNPNYLNDYDGDGLTDDIEIAKGTNPNKQDSDNDGVDDYLDNEPKNGNVGLNAVWFRDKDNDGYGNYIDIKISSSKPVGYVKNNHDYNDNDKEICPLTKWFFDYDNDKFGENLFLPVVLDFPLYPNMVLNNLDCNDRDNSIYPGAPLKSDGSDNNCNGIIDNQEMPNNINNEISEIDFKIYPNPSNGILSIYSNKPLGSFKLINSVGAIVYKSNFNSGSVYDLSYLPKGVYFLNYSNKSYKLIIN